MDDTGALQAALVKELQLPKPLPKKTQARQPSSKGKGGGKYDRTDPGRRPSHLKTAHGRGSGPNGSPTTHGRP